jgi:hypothetical protein
MSIMSIERLHDLFDENPEKDLLSWKGACHDCGGEIEITATPAEDGIHIKGGSVFEPKPQVFFLKCNTCFQNDPMLREYQSCEVYSRVVGYLRPVAQWNDAKQAEFKDRSLFNTGVT